eukprot:jgi/Bigna1/65933/fgenesh1_kg.175_\
MSDQQQGQITYTPSSFREAKLRLRSGQEVMPKAGSTGTILSFMRSRRTTAATTRSEGGEHVSSIVVRMNKLSVKATMERRC